MQSLRNSRSRQNRLLLSSLVANFSLLSNRSPKLLFAKSFDEINASLFIEKYRFSKVEVMLIHSSLALQVSLALDNGSRVDSRIALLLFFID